MRVTHPDEIPRARERSEAKNAGLLLHRKSTHSCRQTLYFMRYEVSSYTHLDYRFTFDESKKLRIHDIYKMKLGTLTIHCRDDVSLKK